MPEWLVWFLVFGNLVNLAFDGTIIVRWLLKRAAERLSLRKKNEEQLFYTDGSPVCYYPNPRDCG